MVELSLFASDERLAGEFTKSHGRTAADVITREVVTVGEYGSLEEIAEILETSGIKRVSVVHDQHRRERRDRRVLGHGGIGSREARVMRDRREYLGGALGARSRPRFPVTSDA
jgi:hypothetical protein